jgi:hypothetical protein
MKSLWHYSVIVVLSLAVVWMPCAGPSQGTNRSLLPALCLSFQPGQSQTSSPQETARPAPAAPDRAEMLAEYQPWCGEPLGLSPTWTKS